MLCGVIYIFSKDGDVIVETGRAFHMLEVVSGTDGRCLLSLEIYMQDQTKFVADSWKHAEAFFSAFEVQFQFNTVSVAIFFLISSIIGA